MELSESPFGWRLLLSERIHPQQEAKLSNEVNWKISISRTGLSSFLMYLVTLTMITKKKVLLNLKAFCGIRSSMASLVYYSHINVIVKTSL